MSTVVFLHAHPDDEAIGTACTIALTAKSGHRALIVFATRGELGELPPDGLNPGETLADRRVDEARAAADILGAAGIEFLGFKDSGMQGDPRNYAAGSFWAADIDVAARRLAHTLRSEAADVLVTYDEGGVSGHPDHRKAHRVATLAATMARTPVVYEATFNRDHLLGLLESARRNPSAELPSLPDPESLSELGVTADRITTVVQGRSVAYLKRAAMAAHASQIGETSLFLSLPPDAFAITWGLEWFIRRRESSVTADDPFRELGVETGAAA